MKNKSKILTWLIDENTADSSFNVVLSENRRVFSCNYMRFHMRNLIRVELTRLLVLSGNQQNGPVIVS